MAKVIGKIIIDIEHCKGCELCVESCPHDCISIADSINAKGYQYAILVNDQCTGCVNCALVCPDAVISVYRKIVREPKPAKIKEVEIS